jgi:hypothetical protein
MRKPRGIAASPMLEMVMQGYAATPLAATLAISRSGVYYRKRPRGSSRTESDLAVLRLLFEILLWQRHSLEFSG